MIDDKNQIIRSMRSYATGGSTDDSCMETVMVAGKPKKKRKQNCNAGKIKRVLSSGEIAKGAAKVVTGIGTLISGIKLNKKYGLVDKAKEKLGLKKGGAVKRTMKKK